MACGLGAQGKTRSVDTHAPRYKPLPVRRLGTPPPVFPSILNMSKQYVAGSSDFGVQGWCKWLRDGAVVFLVLTAPSSVALRAPSKLTLLTPRSLCHLSKHDVTLTNEHPTEDLTLSGIAAETNELHSQFFHQEASCFLRFDAIYKLPALCG
jgi:hypothetical protein